MKDFPQVKYYPTENEKGLYKENPKRVLGSEVSILGGC
jgi:hypothetical protein